MRVYNIPSEGTRLARVSFSLVGSASTNMGDLLWVNRSASPGAIDFNTEFATRMPACLLRDAKSGNGKRLYEMCPDDGLSVCEGELHLHPKRHKGNRLHRQWIAAATPLSASSLNGLWEGINKHAMFSGGASIAGKATVDAIQAHEQVRDHFFKEVHPMGVSVSKWIFPKQGHQQDQYVGTLGGMNTIYCDTDCQAGDTLVVDMPYPTGEEFAGKVDEAKPGTTSTNPWGFIKCVNKKGTPREKVTLVVRPLPDLLASQALQQTRSHSAFNTR